MSVIVEPCESTMVERVPDRGDRMLHLEHPARPGTAWCGAEVLGVTGRFGPVDCVVCVDLRAAWRSSRR